MFPGSSLISKSSPSPADIGSAAMLLRKRGQPGDQDTAKALESLNNALNRILRVMREASPKVTSIYVTDDTGGGTPVRIAQGQVKIFGHGATTVLSNYVDHVTGLTVGLAVSAADGAFQVTPEQVIAFDNANPPVTYASFQQFTSGGSSGFCLYMRSAAQSHSLRINVLDSGVSFIVDGVAGRNGTLTIPTGLGFSTGSAITSVTGAGISTTSGTFVTGISFNPVNVTFAGGIAQ